MIDWNEMGNSLPEREHRPYLWFGEEQDEHVVYFKAHPDVMVRWSIPKFTDVTGSWAMRGSNVQITSCVPKAKQKTKKRNSKPRHKGRVTGLITTPSSPTLTTPGITIHGQSPYMTPGGSSRMWTGWAIPAQAQYERHLNHYKTGDGCAGLQIPCAVSSSDTLWAADADIDDEPIKGTKRK